MTSESEYLRLAPGDSPPEIVEWKPYKAVLVSEVACASEWQDLVGDWLIGSGCLYLMAWGVDCAGWEETVDWAGFRAFPDDDTPEDRFALTTCHAGESLEEVFWFAQYAASHATIELPRTLIVHVSHSDRERELLDCFAVAGREDSVPE